MTDMEMTLLNVFANEIKRSGFELAKSGFLFWPKRLT